MTRQAEPNLGHLGAFMAVAAVAVIGLPALVLSIPLALQARWRRVEMFVLALLGAGATAFLYPGIEARMESALRILFRPGGLSEDPGVALEAAWPHVRAWWVATLGLAPVFACAIELFRTRSVEELRDREERCADRVRAPARATRT